METCPMICLCIKYPYQNTLEYKTNNEVLLVEELLEKGNLKNLLREQSTSIENKYFITNKIIEIYEYYSFEEALNYIEQNLKHAQELDNNYFIEECKLKLSKLLISSGRYKESIDLLSEINKNSLNPNIHITSNPNIIIKGNSASSLGNNLPSLTETNPISNNDIIKPKIIYF